MTSLREIKNYKVCVLMSSYNGENFIAKQIESILKQKDVSVHILIRDDGSVDDTINIIEEYVNENCNIELLKGKNIGWKKSFLQLLRYTKEMVQFDFYAFADQDDIWDEEKIINGIRTILCETNNNKPTLYGSNVCCVNPQMVFLRMLYDDNYKKQNFVDAFPLSSCFFGCTMVWNSKLNNMVNKYEMSTIPPHDILIYMVAMCYGHICYEKKSYINHILHDNNACGVSQNLWERLKKFFRIYLAEDYITTSSSLDSLRKQYGDLGKFENDEFVNAIMKYRKNIKYVFKIICSNQFKEMNIRKQIRTLFFITIGKL